MTQFNLFDNDISDKHIAGLTYQPNYISKAEETALIQLIDNQTWLSDLKRRVQHYGYKYDYRARRIDLSMKIGKLPYDWQHGIAARKSDKYKGIVYQRKRRVS